MSHLTLYVVFPVLVSPVDLLFGLTVAALVASGLNNIYLGRYFRQVEQRLALRLPEGRRVRTSASRSLFPALRRLFPALMLITAGLLFVISSLLREVSVNGTLFTLQTLEFVVTCILFTPVFVFVPLWLFKQKHKSIQRRLGLDVEQHTPRSHPHPKEAREQEQEQGPMRM